jgi:hypothetical protein
MVTDGVRCGSYLATDGYLDPSQLTYALAAGAREGGVQIFTHTRVTGIDVAARPGPRRADRVGPDRGGGRRQRRRHVRRRDRPPGRRARADHSVRARVPRDPAVPRARRRRAPADAARPRPARLLPRGGRGPRDGRLRAPQRAVVARRAPHSTRSPPTSTGACSRRTGRASRRSPRTRAGACRRWMRSPSPADQRARGVHARQRVLPRRERGARLLRRRRLLRARPRRRRRRSAR